MYLPRSEPRYSVRVANALKKLGVPLFLWLFLGKIFIFNCMYVCVEYRCLRPEVWGLSGEVTYKQL